MFYPKGEMGRALRQIKAAKSVCAGCAVRGPCLEEALANGEVYGIWGGLTERERRRFRRLRKTG